MKDLFDKLVYKRVVDNFIDQIQYHFFTGNVPLKRNEALLFCWDIIPKNYEPNILEVNTNTAVDDDLVEWFDFNPIVSALEKWQYDNVIVLVEDGEYDNILEGKWYQSLQATCSKINKKVSIQSCNALDDIWDFKYNKQKDFILRIAWDKTCLIDKFAASKLALKKFMSEQNVSTPKWSVDNSIYEKNKLFVFKKSNIDKKNGISIKKFNSKKEFTKHLSEFDYVEEFIESDVDYQSGFNVEIKHYSLYFKNDFYNMTPNIYSQLYDYHQKDNTLFPNRIGHSNLLYKDDIGKDFVNSNVHIQSPFHYKYIRINGEFDFSHSASILVYQFKRGDFKPAHLIEVGDVLLRNNEKVEVKSVDVISEKTRVKAIQIEDNVIEHNGFQIQAKHENFISGVDSIIVNPIKGQEVLSSDEEELVSAIMSKAKDAEMPERVVEITFECSGTFFTSEFLFEKPLKVINSMDYDIRMDRTDGREKFGTHNTAGVEKKKPTFGWASYNPKLTYELKHMSVMKLRPGMVCLTPKPKHFKRVQGLYGGFVPCKVVSMKEVTGKKSHWDIYEILPTENYFMNRLKVHNGPAKYSLTNGPDMIGHWDIGHPSSFSTPDDTIFDLTSRLNADMTLHSPGQSPNSTTNFSATNHPGIGLALGANNPEFRALDFPSSQKGARFAKQPSNPYHTQTLFNTQVPTTIVWANALAPLATIGNDTWPTPAGAPNSPANRRFSGQNPGTNFDMKLTDGGNEPQSRWAIYSGNGWVSVPTSFLFTNPTAEKAFGRAVPGPKTNVDYLYQKMDFTAVLIDQSSPHYRIFGKFNQPSALAAAGFQGDYTVPTPGSNPRSPSNSMAFGGNAYPTPTQNEGAFAWSHVVIYDAVLQWQEIAAQCGQIVAGYPNSRYYFRTLDPGFDGDGTYPVGSGGP